MKSEIQINNTAGVCQIDIEGTIGVPEEWQFEEPDARVATYERFRDTLRRIAEIEAPEVVVNIRSTGGDVNDALLIHDALRQLPARVTTRCYGYTASAATIIAQAASEGCRLLSANALYLIHTAICSTEGNAAEIAGKTRPAAPDRCAYRRGLCIPFGASGRGVRGPDGREQRQRPLARHPRRPLRRDWPTKWSKLRSSRRPRWRGISPGAGSVCSASIGLRPGEAASRRPQRSPLRRGGAGSAQPFGCCGRRSPPAAPRRPPRSRARTPPAATRSARPTNAPMPKTQSDSADNSGTAIKNCPYQK